ncbi:sensor histidine kinase [Virgisporangium aliadipatigenens]|nr:histidine kinase [Virgisporangium aliadipatigenens]
MAESTVGWHGWPSLRDRTADLVCFLLAVGCTALVSVEGARGPVPVAVDVILGGLCCLGVWVRRRWPVAFAVVAVGCAVVSASAGWVAFIALFTVAVHRRAATAALVAAWATVACVGSVLVGLDTTMQWWQASFSVVVFATVVGWGMFVRARRQLDHSVRERQRQAEEDQFAQARRQERLRIAREMHDVLAHRISLVSLHAGALELRPDRPADEVARAAGVIRDSAHQALEELRAVIGVLRADPADSGADDAPQRPQPTLADLPELAAEARQAGNRVELEWRLSDPAAVPEVLGRSAYRIVQEGLTNARKHAHGADVWVTVDGRRGDGLTVEVRNPCPREPAGDSAVPGAGSGIVGLAERTDLAGGRLEHGRTPTGDFALKAWLPWAS